MECEHHWLPTDYDPSSPYGLTTLSDYGRIGDIEVKNGFHCLTKEEAAARRKNGRQSNEEPRRVANVPGMNQPRRTSISDTHRPHNPQIATRRADAGTTIFSSRSEMVTNINSVISATPAKRFRIPDTPPPQTKARRFSVD